MSEQDNLQEADGIEKTQNETTPEVVETTNEAIEGIEATNAEDAENEVSETIIEEKDYSEMSLDAMAIELEKLVNGDNIQAVKNQVNTLKETFKTKYDELVETRKQEFLAEGGNEIDFHFNSPIYKRFKNTYYDYRKKVENAYKQRQESLKTNLEKRLAIIEELKGLLNVEENINTTYKHFKDLQERWRNAGAIPRDKYNNAWNSYHHHVERFYDFLHLNRDLRDLDFKHNLEQKQKIIERAENLAQSNNVNHAFRELQALHKIWKEELGPVAKEHRDEIWDRFKAATKTIHDKRQEYYAELDKLYEKNLVVKQEIIDKIAAVAQDNAKSHSQWQAKIKEVEALRKEFFDAGKVPIKVNEATWAKFKDTVRTFNRNKNAFYKSLKGEQYENLQKKLDLIKVAEDNKESDDFDTITPLMKKIQSDWKKIGHVPRKESDKVWKRFKDACNYYFDRINAKRNEANKGLMEAYDKKVKLLEDVKSVTLTGNNDDDLSTIKQHISQWKTLGRVPGNKRHIEGDFNKVLDGLFSKLDINKTEAELIKYDNKLQELSSGNERALNDEQNFIRKKVDEIRGEINQLENNLQFFSNVDENNPLVKDVHKNIKKHKDNLVVWQQKMNKIRALRQQQEEARQAATETPEDSGQES